MPRRFRLGLAPPVGVEMVDVAALPRYRSKDGRLGVGRTPLRSDQADRVAFIDIHAAITTTVAAPVSCGAASRLVWAP